MERLEARLKDTIMALATLREIVNEPYTIIVRDAAIQRFEYTFEAFWKFIKEYLRIKEKIAANSPKQCFRELFIISVISEEENVKLLEMTDNRNMTSHTYNKDVANGIYSGIKAHYALMSDVVNRLEM